MLRDPLQRYREKRDFSKTAEPSGARGKRKAPGGLTYLIQKHEARTEHYDFRLEHDGVLLSWACPKGPSLDPADKRLAVHVEDHPLDYAEFEGTIPQGQYGAGTVMLWDYGNWTPHSDVDEGLREGKLSFDLDGARLHGGWALVKMHGRPGDNWLLIKEKDAEARPHGRPVVETDLTSVKTGRTMGEIAGIEDAPRTGKAEAAPRKAARSASKTTASVRAKSRTTPKRKRTAR